MLAPFYTKLHGDIYEIIEEEGGTFTIFKWDNEYIQILRNKNKKWMRIDYKTDLPIVEENDEVEDLGSIIDQRLEKSHQ